MIWHICYNGEMVSRHTCNVFFWVQVLVVAFVRPPYKVLMSVKKGKRYRLSEKDMKYLFFLWLLID